MTVIIKEPVESEVSTEQEKKLELKNDVRLPPRSSIRKELLKVSNFSEAEIAVLWWSSLYKAYSLIVRYEQKGVEDEFRRMEWFQEALKETPAEVKTEKNNENSNVKNFYSGNKKNSSSYDYTVHLKSKSNEFSKAFSKN